MKYFLVAAMLIVAHSTFALADDFRPIFHPPTSSILEALQQDPDNFSTLIGLLKQADLKELRDSKASYTLLAPTNAAFAKLSPEEFTRLTIDPQKLRQLLLAHLLPGRIMFMQLFAPASGGVAKKNVTESLNTADGGLAYFVCNEHPPDPEKQHHPLINKEARVLKSDIEGKYSVVQVIDAVLIPRATKDPADDSAIAADKQAQTPNSSPTAPFPELSATAKGQFVACPLKESRTEVTTSLPEPWWNTPQIGSLERTSVQTIGGNRTLVCEYSAYGRTVNVMRLFPEGTTDCAAEGNGFQCH
jgi:uncharacterized surface protein with fasciclin (FAS1) repeats